MEFYNTPALVNIILLYLCIIYVLLQIEINVQQLVKDISLPPPLPCSEHYNLQLGGLRFYKTLSLRPVTTIFTASQGNSARQKEELSPSIGLRQHRNIRGEKEIGTNCTYAIMQFYFSFDIMGDCSTPSRGIKPIIPRDGVEQ